MESTTNVLLTIWNKIIMTNINNFGYVRRRILNSTCKNPFRKKFWGVIWLPIVPIAALFFLAKTCVAPLTCCPIVSTTPKVPLKLQSVHFKKKLSVKAHYGGQNMLSQTFFFKIMQLSTSTKPILKEVFINILKIR